MKLFWIIVITALVAGLITGGAVYGILKMQERPLPPIVINSAPAADNLKTESKQSEMTKVDVSSDQYTLQIPIPEGFEFKKLYPNFEFILSNKSNTDKNYFIFYFESDYSPGYDDTAVEQNSFEVISKQGKVFVVRYLISTVNNDVLYYIEAKNDKRFHFSVLHDNSNIDTKQVIIKEVIENLSFVKK